MAHTIVGICTIKLHLPGVSSLKEKRGVLKSMLARMHNTFNVSAAEIDHLDVWQSSTIAVALVSNSSRHVYQVIQSVLEWIEGNYPNAMVVDQEIEIL
jgi:uncharacterized protein YlxP (DUF503 family)